MPASYEELAERINKLGLKCEQLSLEEVTSPVAALACFPMYMVANVHAWTDQTQWHVPILDLPGIEEVREAFAIGRAEAALNITRDHRRVLGSLLAAPRPSDLVIYEYALETLRLYLEACEQHVADAVRKAIAKTSVAVAQASGASGFTGSGEKITDAERACLGQINDTLGLTQNEDAAAQLKDVL